MLLLDHNISYKLLRDKDIKRVFPGIRHVYLLNLHNSNDKVLWEYARKNNLIIVSKDNDFRQLFSEYGYPPAVIKLNLGNCSNQKIKTILLKYEDTIRTDSKQYGLMIIEQ